MKPKKFRKVVKYYYPNGEEYDEGVFAWWVVNISFFVVVWVFFPLFFIFDKDFPYRGHREVCWEEIKE